MADSEPQTADTLLRRKKNTMQTRTLGRTGFNVSEIGFGAATIGGKVYGNVPRGEAVKTVEKYLEAGGNLIDTSRGYGSEEIIGEAIERCRLRTKVYLATKTMPPTETMDDIPKLRKDLEASLRALKIDYVDLYYFKGPTESHDLMNRVLEEFDSFKKEGKIRAIGVPVKGPAVTDRTVSLCRQYTDTGQVDVLQLTYSILKQRNAESIEYASANGLGVVASTTLEHGFLTGKYAPDSSFNDYRRRWKGKHLRELLEEILKIKDWAVRAPYTSLSQVALKFALANNHVSTVIPGARNGQQIAENLSVGTLPPLEPDILGRLLQQYGEFTEQANP